MLRAFLYIHRTLVQVTPCDLVVVIVVVVVVGHGLIKDLPSFYMLIFKTGSGSGSGSVSSGSSSTSRSRPDKKNTPNSHIIMEENKGFEP